MHTVKRQQPDLVMASAATNNDDFDSLALAWRELQTRIPVELRTIGNECHYRAMVGFMNKLIDEIGDQETHPLMDLLDLVTLFVRDYEMRTIEIPDAAPPAVLRFLLEQHSLRPADLAEIFGSESDVSEVLNGKREIGARQAHALGGRFAVSPVVFIEV